jgi:hypothetical protein
MLNTGKQLIVIRLVLILEDLGCSLSRGHVECMICFGAGEEEGF